MKKHTSKYGCFGILIECNFFMNAPTRADCSGVTWLTSGAGPKILQMRLYKGDTKSCAGRGGQIIGRASSTCRNGGRQLHYGEALVLACMFRAWSFKRRAPARRYTPGPAAGPAGSACPPAVPRAEPRGTLPTSAAVPPPHCAGERAIRCSLEMRGGRIRSLLKMMDALWSARLGELALFVSLEK